MADEEKKPDPNKDTPPPLRLEDVMEVWETAIVPLPKPLIQPEPSPLAPLTPIILNKWRDPDADALEPLKSYPGDFVEKYGAGPGADGETLRDIIRKRREKESHNPTTLPKSDWIGDWPAGPPPATDGSSGDQEKGEGPVPVKPQSTHIAYLGHEHPAQEPTAKQAGWDGPGWYFFDEAGSSCYGPYDSEEMAAVSLKRYCETLQIRKVPEE